MGNDNVSLIKVPSHLIDWAWADGADCLKEACAEECSIDQLRFLLVNGEKQLVRMDRDGKTCGWGVYKIDQYPNMRVFHVSHLVARNAHFEQFFSELRIMAEQLGCSRIRCSAKPAQSRIYKMKLGFESVYETLEVKLC